MTVEGHGKRDIAKALTVDKILIPAAYAAEHCPKITTVMATPAPMNGSAPP